MGMVKAAYSSGKPALGVGAGNVQCILDEDADFSTVIPMVITGRAFDNGILCSAEQSIIAPKSGKEALYDALRESKTYIVTDDEDRNKLREALFQYGAMNKAVIGQSIGSIAQLAGLSVPEGTRVIAVETENAADILGKEKMCPVLALYFFETFEEAVAIAKSNLEREGKGHSVAIHSHNTAHIEYAANALSVSRFVINQCSATSAGGSFYNGFAPTNTLGCGSWGGNSISENLDYKHLINLSRIGYYMPNNPVPTEEELWK
jgi:succinate-semialdehyde dehydrogenase